MGRKKGTPKTEGSGRLKGVKVKQLTDDDYQKWVTIVIELMTVKGATKWMVIKQLCEQGLSPFQAKQTIDKAFVSIKKIYSEKAETALEYALAQLYELYFKCLNEQDKATALNVRKEINRLLELGKDKIQVDGSMVIPQIINIVEVNKDGTQND